MFIHTNQPLITSFSIKKVPNFCRISDESAFVRNFLRNGRVRVKSQKFLFVGRCYFISFEIFSYFYCLSKKKVNQNCLGAQFAYWLSLTQT